MQNLQEAISKIRKAGIEVNNRGLMLCQFHSERKPSARLWYNSYHNQIEYHCFGCGASYKFETFYKIITDKEYKQERFKKRISRVTLDFLTSRLNAYFLTLLEGDFDDPKYGEAISLAETGREYLEGRGLKIDDIKRYSIGFIMQGDTQRLEGIKDNSWAKDKTRYCFLTFPIRNEKGNVVTMQFEDFIDRDKRDDTKLNLRGTLPLWYNESPNEESKDNEEWAICEGLYDAMSFDMAGVKAIALLGQPSKKRIEGLKEFNHLLFALDNDETGRRYKGNLSKELYPYSTLREVIYPKGAKDPNELLQKQGIDGIMGLMEKAQAIDLFPPLIDTIDIMIEDYLKLKEQAIQIPTEFNFLEKFLPNRLLPGLYALAGIPGVGKTTILNQLADSLAKEKIPTVYFLTEEPAYRLIQRTVKKEGLDSMKELRYNQPKILKYRRIFEMTPDYIAEKLKDIIQGIKFRLKVEGEHHPVFILDSLQALRLSKGIERIDIREKTILKAELLSHIARDLNIPVIFTSFIAREYYPKGKNSEKGPTLAIFKESGDIEYLIDVGICLWVKKQEELKADEPEIEIHFVKNRFGKQGGERLILKKEECRFDYLE
ncbi:MAG: DnaB-like helicase C-terminal domain-containing protein [Candidatus Aerophobetes bacterium]|nr:DnaB-like helicase C-terminal domain-containing protein [Candidatus Aerophobetes bacterium]